MGFKKSGLISLYVFIVISMVFTGCASTPKATPSTKKSANQKQKKRIASQADIAAQMNQAQDAQESLGSWFARLSSANSSYTIQDRQYVNAMAPSPKPHSLEEAALAIGLLREAITPPGVNSVANPLNYGNAGGRSVLPDPTKPANDANTIERLSREHGLDFVQALENNSFLKTAVIYGWAWNAVINPGNTDIFRSRVSEVILVQVKLWDEISLKVFGPKISSVVAPVHGGVTPEGALNQTAPSAGTGSSMDSGQPVLPPAVIPSASAGVPGADLTGNRGSDPESIQTLQKAQDFAAKESYKSAITEAGKIQSSSPQYEIAQENIRQWSNRAVTDLRKKAAFEYRTASSTADPNTKKNALGKAKAHLEEALSSFPAASNLDTVRDNLTLIESEMK
jgi:hypothetical protein